jgi:hypothetical protein
MLKLQMSRDAFFFRSSVIETAPNYDPLLNLAIAKTREWRQTGNPPSEAKIFFPDGKFIDLMGVLCQIP